MQDTSSIQTHVSMAKEFIGPLTGKFSDRPNTGINLILGLGGTT